MRFFDANLKLVRLQILVSNTRWEIKKKNLNVI